MAGNRKGRSSSNPVEGAKVVGAVMVVGGGIAGMQASLDLAESGYKVYLVEAKSAIGGHMAQLDKTFPTNDCAMCTISPKLIETGRNLNIEILTDTTVAGLQGTAGDFNVTLRTRPRYIDGCDSSGPPTSSIRKPFQTPTRSRRRALHPAGMPALPISAHRAMLPSSEKVASAMLSASSKKTTPSRASAAASAITGVKMPAIGARWTIRSTSTPSSAS
jgi:hypothetical protein